MSRTSLSAESCNFFFFFEFKSPLCSHANHVLANGSLLNHYKPFSSDGNTAKDMVKPMCVQMFERQCLCQEEKVFCMHFSETVLHNANDPTRGSYMKAVHPGTWLYSVVERGAAYYKHLIEDCVSTMFSLWLFVGIMSLFLPCSGNDFLHAYSHGDIIIGGLFPLHSTTNRSTIPGPLSCMK